MKEKPSSATSQRQLHDNEAKTIQKSKPTPKESRHDTMKRKSDRGDKDTARTPPPRMQKTPPRLRKQVKKERGRASEKKEETKETIFDSFFKGGLGAESESESKPGKQKYIKQAGYRRVGRVEKPKGGASLWGGIAQKIEDPFNNLTFL